MASSESTISDFESLALAMFLLIESIRPCNFAHYIILSVDDPSHFES